jgi:TRAP-type C4-dicarboxylate transport system substrate-binding protein
MIRRTLIKTGIATALAAAAVTSFAQQTVTLKFHTFMAPQSGVWLNMHKPWMAKVEKESGGRIKFEAYPAMQLGGTPVQLDLAQQHRRPLPACRSVRAALHDDQCRSHFACLLGICPNPSC